MANPPMTDNDIAAVVAAAKLDERERCAKIAADWKSPLRPGTEARFLGHQEAAREIAEDIHSQKN